MTTAHREVPRRTGGAARAVRAVVCAVAAAAAWAPVGASAQARVTVDDPLIFAGPRDEPPFFTIGADGQPTGYTVELLRAIAREAGVRIEFRVMGRAERREAFLSGKAHLADVPLASDLARNATPLVPLWRARRVALSRQLQPELDRIDELAGRRVAVVADSAAFMAFQALPADRQPLLVPVPSNAEAIETLRRGDAAFAVGNSLAMRATPRYWQSPRLFEAEVGSNPFYIMASPGNEHLQPTFAAAYLRLQESGELISLIERTILDAENPSQASPWVGYVAGAALVGAIALAGMMVWSRSLHARVQRQTAELRGALEQQAAVERELRTAVARQRATLEATAEGVLATDAGGRVVAYNQRFVELWGLPADVLAVPHFDAWVEWASKRCVDPDAGVAQYRAARDSDGVHSAVFELKDGRVFERQSHPQIVDGMVVGRVWCFRDLSDWVRAEDERRQLEAQMQQVQKLESLGVLAGGIAHDFNNLLVGILGHANLAVMDAPPDSPVTERIRQIEVAAQRAAELTNQMLAYSGKGRFVVQHTDLSEIAKEMAELLRTAVSRHAELDLQLAPNLPPFEGDQVQIRQVIMNLITNASDALEGNPGRIVLATGCQAVSAAYLADARVGRDERPGDYVFVEVTDNGSGMAPATLTRIFDPFFTTKFTGRGLGLAAVLGIVRSHRGAIKITSSPGQGTTFRVLLPAVAATVRPAAPPVLTPATVTGTTVLVVDDESPVRRVASEILRRAGFDVRAASGGEEAIELFRREGADVVLVDMMMPRMDGAETARRLRALDAGVAIVLMSGYGGDEAAARFGADRPDGFVQKPFASRTLIAAVTTVAAMRTA